MEEVLLWLLFVWLVVFSVPTFLNALREIRKFIRELMGHSE